MYVASFNYKRHIQLHFIARKLVFVDEKLTKVVYKDT